MNKNENEFKLDDKKNLRVFFFSKLVLTFRRYSFNAWKGKTARHFKRLVPPTRVYLRTLSHSFCEVLILSKARLRNEPVYSSIKVCHALNATCSKEKQHFFVVGILVLGTTFGPKTLCWC